jgi:hypothetical protein
MEAKAMPLMLSRICASSALVVVVATVIAGPVNAAPRSPRVTRAEIAANLLTAEDVFGTEEHPPTGYSAQPDGLCGVQLPAPQIQVDRDWSSHSPTPPPRGGFTLISVSGAAFNGSRTANAAVRTAYNAQTKCVGRRYGRFQRHFAHTTAYCTVTQPVPNPMVNDEVCAFVRKTVAYRVEVFHYGGGTAQMLWSLTSLAVKKVYCSHADRWRLTGGRPELAHSPRQCCCPAR